MTKWGMLLVLVAVLIGGTHVDAQIIDFETTAGGGAPSDDLVATGPFLDGATLVDFGFDIDGDDVIDVLAYFDDLGPEVDEFPAAYAHGSGLDADDSIKDTDASPGLEGKSFILRRPDPSEVGGVVVDMTTHAFIVAYSGFQPKRVAGQIWDVDGGEQYLVEALGGGGVPIANMLSPVGLLEEVPGSLSGRPWNFSFLLPQSITALRVTQVAGDSRGFAFDNFDATGVTVVPEPATLSLVGLGLLALARRRRKA